MSTRPALIVLAAIALMPTLASAQQSPDQAFAFAKQLEADGDKAFALLEYKRFLFLNDRHAKAPDAAKAVARMYVAYLNDVDKAKKTLAAYAAKHGRLAAGQKVRAYQTFLEANSDNNGQPLKLYLGGESAEVRGDWKEAEDKYNTLLRDFGRSRLADNAMMRLGYVSLIGKKNAREALDRFNTVLRNYATSDVRPEADLGYAEATHVLQGNTVSTQQAYRHVMTAHPNTDAARKASQKLAAMTGRPTPTPTPPPTTTPKPKPTDPPKPADKNVPVYKLEREGYTIDNDNELVVIISFAKNLTEAQIRAAFDDAIAKRKFRREKTSHTMLIEGYFSYPNDKAGYARWQPNNRVSYSIKKRSSEDAVRDTILDLLKGN